MALLAMAIKSMGYEARSYTGSQAGMITDAHARLRAHRRRHPGAAARGARRGRDRHRRRLPGLQPRHARTSRRSAAAAPTRPPSRSPRRSTPTSARSTPTSTASSPPTRASCRSARKIDRITSEEMLELAAAGAKVLYIRAVEYARRHGVTLHVRSSFNNNEGTWVDDPARRPKESRGRADHHRCRGRPQRGQDHRRRRARRSGQGRRRSSRSSRSTGANIDMIVQNVSAATTGRHRHLVHAAEGGGREGADGARAASRTRSASTRCSTTTRSASSRSSARACARTPASRRSCSRRCRSAGINIEMISTSEIRISVVDARRQRARRRARRAHGVRARRRRRRRRPRRHRPLSDARAHPVDGCRAARSSRSARIAGHSCQGSANGGLRPHGLGQLNERFPSARLDRVMEEHTWATPTE